MIISVEKLKEFITTDVSNMLLEARLEALEASIRHKTHNNFQDRRYRSLGMVKDGVLGVADTFYFKVGDTIMVDDDLCVITDIEGRTVSVDIPLLDSEKVLVTKVVYPKDIIIGAVDVISWMIENPSDKAGIASETLSRHSVSYQGSSEFDSDIGCPVRLLSFLNQYVKARF